MARFFGASFLEAGHEVTVFHGPEPRDSVLPALRFDGARTEPFHALGRPWPPMTAWRLAKRLKRHNIDALVAFQQRDRPIALQAARAAGAAAVVSVQNEHVFRGPRPLAALKSRYYRWTLRRYADLLVCTSDHTHRDVLDRFGIDQPRSITLANGVDVAAVQRAAPADRQAVRDQFGVGPDQLMLLSVGRLVPQKGYEVLLEALAKLPETSPPWKLVVVGDVDGGANRQPSERYAARIRQQVSEAGLSDRVHFAGWRDDVPALMHGCDMFVHAAWWEGGPLTLVEAMAASRPFAGTACGLWPTGFENGKQGWMVPRGDAAGLSEAIADLMQQSAQQRQAMGELGRAVAEEELDIKKLGPLFVKYIEALCPVP